MSYDETYQEPPPEAPVSNTLTVTGVGNGIESFDSYKPSKNELETKETLKIKINLDNG